MDRPTGAAYTAAAQEERERHRALREREEVSRVAEAEADAVREYEVRQQIAKQGEEDGSDVDSDDELLNVSLYMRVRVWLDYNSTLVCVCV